MSTIGIKLPFPEKSILYSLAFHLALLSGGALVQFLDHLNKPKQIEYLEFEMVAPQTTAPDSLKGQSVGFTQRGQFASLLAQTSRGTGLAKLSSKAKSTQSKFSVEQMTNGLRRGLLESTKADTATTLRAGGLQKSAAIQWDKLQTVSQSVARTMNSEIDREAIRKAIASHEDEFRSCHERALLADMSLSGQADLAFNVGSGGTVLSAQVLFTGKGAAGREILRSCLVTESKRVKFPAKTVGHQVIFTLLLR